MKKIDWGKKLVKFLKNNVELKSVCYFFLDLFIMKISKMIQKHQLVPHENQRAWLGIRIVKQVAKSQLRMGEKWEASWKKITGKQRIIAD